MLLAALRRLGAHAEMAPPRPPVGVGAGACFAVPVGGEITVRGRKLVGSAQLREGAGLLQHGSLLLTGRQEPVQEVTLGGASPDLAGALAEALGCAPDPADVAEAVAFAAAERWGGIWERTAPFGDLLAEASRHEVRFRSPAWTWRA